MTGGVIGIVTGRARRTRPPRSWRWGCDPRFDLTHAYWLIAGIAGIDPADGSIGSAVWAEWTVDGDLAHQLDERETPKDWPTGYVPLGGSVPYQKDISRMAMADNVVFHLNPRSV